MRVSIAANRFRLIALLKGGFLLILLVGLTAGCHISDCRHNDRYQNEPGICGKIYRLEAAKQRFAQVGQPAVFWILGLVFLPILLWIGFHLIRWGLVWIGRRIQSWLPPE